MVGIDASREQRALRIAILTVSDTRTEASDASGSLLRERVESSGHRNVHYAIVPDDRTEIEGALRTLVARADVDVVVATGGTGITARDVTPEAFFSVYDKEIPGFGELFRTLSYEVIGTSTIQSRATAGVTGGTLLFALPGSTSACRDAWDRILVNQLDSRYRPCNFAELLPRLGDELTEPKS